MGDLDVDLVHHMATLSGAPLQLTAKEFELLAYLARHAGKVCTHHMILKDVWGPGYGAESNYVRVYAHRLRKKIGGRRRSHAQDRSRHRLPAGGRRSPVGPEQE